MNDKLFFLHNNAIERIVKADMEALRDEKGRLAELNRERLTDQLEHARELRAMRQGRDYKKS
jgi:hypothetical protein